MGNSSAMYNYARIKYYGVKGVIERDVMESRKWYSKSGEEFGNSDSLLQLALFYHKGEKEMEIEKNELKAISFYEKACEANNKEAMFYLVSIFFFFQNFFFFFYKIFFFNFFFFQAKLLLEKSHFFPLNFPRAIQLLQKSSSLLHSPSLFLLCKIYQFGDENFSPQLSLSLKFYFRGKYIINFFFFFQFISKKKKSLSTWKL